MNYCNYLSFFMLLIIISDKRKNIFGNYITHEPFFKHDFAII